LFTFVNVGNWIKMSVAFNMILIFTIYSLQVYSRGGLKAHICFAKRWRFSKNKINYFSYKFSFIGNTFTLLERSPHHRESSTLSFPVNTPLVWTELVTFFIATSHKMENTANNTKVG
jgi:hypothetical protein